MKPRAITEQERIAMEPFLKLQLSLDDLLLKLDWKLELDFLPNKRVLTSRLLPAEPPIPVARRDLERAISMRRSGQIDDRQIVRWATMIVLNDCFLWGEADDQLTDMLHEISIGGLDACDRWGK